jgi:polar amino acid transport system permease protein
MDFAGILSRLAQGVGYTLLVTVACCATGLITGLVVAGFRRIAPSWVVALCDIFTYVFRSVPALVLLFLVYFGLPGIGVRVSPLVAMMLSLGLIAGAYLAEVFRGALDAVDESEVVAALASGMTRRQALHYIEFPQMLRFSVPGMVNEFTTVLKYSPFAYTVGIPEITRHAMALAATTLRGMEIYVAVGILYFIVYRLLLAVVRVVEHAFRVPGIGPEHAQQKT